MKDENISADGDHHSAPFETILVAFIVAALLTSFVAKVLGVSHVMGVVPLGGLVGAALAEWLWRVRHKA